MSIRSEGGKSRSVLETFFAEIERLSGFRLSIYDLTYFTQGASDLDLPRAYRIHCSAYCQRVKQGADAIAQCRKVEMLRANKAAAAGKAILHTCHAGITDLVLPLKHGRRDVGALYFGQVRSLPAGKQRALTAQAAKQFGCDAEELQRSYETVPAATVAQLKQWLPLLNCLKGYLEQAGAVAGARHERSSSYLSAVRALAQGGCKEALPMADLPNFYLDKLKPESEQIRRAVELIRQSYWTEISQGEIAQRAGLSPSQFSRRFRSETGVSFRMAISAARAYAAAFLVKKTSLSATQMAEALGYRDVSSFQRAFTRHLGCPPTKFLRQNPPI